MAELTLPTPEDCRDWLHALPGRLEVSGRDLEVLRAIVRGLDERDARAESARWARGALRRIWCITTDDRLRPALATVREALGDSAPRLAAILEREGWEAADPEPTPLNTSAGPSQ